MRTAGVVLVLLSALSQCVESTSCPDSCMVCSEYAIICHKLSTIIGVPLTITALMLTDGQISSLDNSSFFGLTNMTLLALSNNIIVDILNNAFQNLSALRTLLLDHNKITISSITESTFSQLQSLEILQLGNNGLHEINGKWFQDTRSLLTLQLEGNLITRVKSGTFVYSNLKNLRTLDLSGNLITYIAKDSFHNLPQLHSLDLSRNSLRSAPDAFSSLPWLSKLNLVFNQWNCTCELWKLASFLRSYLQIPEKELYNSKLLVCLSSASSAVLNVLQLTEANCMPPNKNITMLVKIKDRISMQQYIQNISLVASFFFAGGVGVIIGAMYCKMELSNNRSWSNRSTDVVASDDGILNQGVPWWGFNDNNKVQVLSITDPGSAEAKLMRINEEETSKLRQRFREIARQDLKQTRLDSCFVCHSCNQDGLVPSSTGGLEGAGSSKAIVVQGDSWLATMSAKQKKLAPREEVRGHMSRLALKSNEDGPHQGDQTIYQKQYNNMNHDFHMMPTILHPDVAVHGASHEDTRTPKLSNCQCQINSLQSRVSLNAFKESCNKLPHNDGKLENIQTLPDYLNTKCLNCHQTFEYRKKSSRERGNTMEGRINQTFEQQYKREENTDDRIDHKQDPTDVDGDYSNLQKKPCMKPPQKRVSFDLRQSGAQNNESHKEANIQNIKKSKLKVHSNSLLKVKMNLNPFRKRRIHAQKNLNREEMLLDKNKKAASIMAKRAKVNIKAEKGDRDLSETINTDKHKPAEKSKKQPSKCLQNKLSQTIDSTNMTGSQQINTKENKNGNLQLEVQNSDGMQMISIQPQNNQIDGYPQTDTTASHSQSVSDVPNPDILNGSRTAENVPDNLSNNHSMTAISSAPTLIEEYLPSAEHSPKRKIRLILPERTSSRSQTPLEKKIR